MTELAGRAMADSATAYPRFTQRRSTLVRGATWWGKAWVRAVEESAYDLRDLKAGRSLARSGRVGSIQVQPGLAVVSTQAIWSGADELFTSTLRLPVFDPATWESFVALAAAEAGHVAALLAGDLPHRLVEHAEEAGVELLPFGAELEASCGCAAVLQPCRHALALMYQLTWLLDDDPLVLMLLRGMDRERLLGLLHDRSSSPGADESDVVEELATDAVVRARRILALVDEQADGWSEGAEAELNRLV